MTAVTNEIVKNLTKSSVKINDFEAKQISKIIDSIIQEKEIEQILRQNTSRVINELVATRKKIIAKNIMVEELKRTLSEKRLNTSSALHDAANAKSKKIQYMKQVDELRRESEEINKAMEEIIRITQNLSSKEREMANTVLKPAAVKKTAELEKKNVDLKSIEKIESELLKKAEDMQDDLEELETYCDTRNNEVENITINATNNIEHITKSFESLSNISIDLLRSSLNENSRELDITQS